MEALRRLSRRLRVVEHAVGVGLFILTAVLFCFVCWEYRVAFPVWKTGGGSGLSMVVRGGQVSATSAVAGSGAAQYADLSAASAGDRAAQYDDLVVREQVSATSAVAGGGAAQDVDLSAEDRAAQYADLVVRGGQVSATSAVAGSGAAQDADLSAVSAGDRAAQYAELVVRGGQVSATSAVVGGGAAQDADLSAVSAGDRAAQYADLSAAAQDAELSMAAQDAELSGASAGDRAAQYAELSVASTGERAAQDADLSAAFAGDRAADLSAAFAGDRAAQDADLSARDRALQDGDCDWSEGNWVWDESYPLYQSRDCPFMDGGFQCSDNGRPDRSYTKWRWQPSHCNLPRFDAKTMLEKLRNRRLVFVGDSIGRNQWESLLCMLSSAFPNKTSIYEVNGRPISKHDGFFVYMFKDYNCTVEYYRAPFLVVQGRAPHGAPKKVRRTLRLDVLDWTSKRWRDADILIFNTGHWWNTGKTINGGSFFQEGVKVKMEMSVESAYERAIKTLFDWIHKEVNRRKTQVIFRSYAPVHFRSGDWKTGGSCHLETLPELGSTPLSLEPWANLLHPFMNISKDRSLDAPAPELDLLNVTQLTARRKDGHLSLYYLGPSKTAPLHRQDCSHWCLPGVPDVWNELVYALILKRDTMINQTSLSTD